MTEKTLPISPRKRKICSTQKPLGMEKTEERKKKLFRLLDIFFNDCRKHKEGEREGLYRLIASLTNHSWLKPITLKKRMGERDKKSSGLNA